MTIYKRITLVSSGLIITGAVLIAPFFVIGNQNSQALQTSPPPLSPAPVVKTIAQGKPRHITIAPVKIDLPVEDGVYDKATGKWTLHNGAAFWGTPTSPANSESGNTFIYAHNNWNIFGGLPNIKVGQTAVITTDTGYEFTYEFYGSEKVKPTDTMALEYHGDTPRLTLQTCSGFWNETRHMFYFKLVGYRHL